MKRLLVTGGAGILGSFIVKDLARHKKYDVTATFHPDEPPAREIKKLARFIAIDLTDKAKTFRLVKGFDYIIHLAALVQGTGRYHDAPATALSENLTIDTNVLHAAAIHKVKRFIYTSSHEVLRSLDTLAIDEKIVDTAFPYPENAYAFSKLVGERLCKAYYQEYGLPYVIAYNLSYDYGVLLAPMTKQGYLPRIVGGITKAKQKKSGWIPWYMEAIQTMLANKKPLVFRGDPKGKRYWTDLRDTAAGMVRAIDAKGIENQSLFLGSEQMLTTEEVIKLFFEKIHPQEKLKAQYVKTNRIPSLSHIPNTKKAQTLLGWKPQYRLEDSVEEIIAWVRDGFWKPR